MNVPPMVGKLSPGWVPTDDGKNWVLVDARGTFLRAERGYARYSTREEAEQAAEEMNK